MTDLLEHRLAAFAAGSLDLPDSVVQAGCDRVLDSIGVGMAAYLSPPARIARRLAPTPVQGETARLWGDGRLTTLEDAAFANGVMVRYLDLNDAWRTKDAHHPSDYLPGLLGVAAAVGASGQAFIEALAVAYEVMCRFTDEAPLNAKGWDQPVTGALGTALAAGRLMGLTEAQLTEAVALALIPNLATYQTRAGELSMWKGCAGPNGARNGIFAARLARESMTGPEKPFDGVFGLWQQTLDGTAYDFDLPGPTWGLEQTNIKTHAVRDSCQLPIFTALELREKLAGRPPEALTIETYQSAWEGAVKDPELWAPKTRETADHSMLFSVACALIDGKVTPDSFEDGRFADADVRDLISRTDVVVLDAFSVATPEERNCRITARLDGGGDVAAHRVVTLDDIKRGMPAAELEAKFRTCTNRCYTAGEQDSILAATRALASMADVAVLPPMLDL